MLSSVSQKVKVRKSYHKKSKKTKNKREEIIQEDDVEKDKECGAILKFERKQFNERKKLSNTPLLMDKLLHTQILQLKKFQNNIYL
ncbi:MAG: hypothetical protein KTV77_04010 [Wolbachia endosymbiont of Fragariocoptes setiger]|nr:hypothetical protein [Wolbachia endosymbiont of Fragariocoptes setiger]